MHVIYVTEYEGRRMRLIRWVVIMQNSDKISWLLTSDVISTFLLIYLISIQTFEQITWSSSSDVSLLMCQFFFRIRLMCHVLLLNRWWFHLFDADSVGVRESERGREKVAEICTKREFEDYVTRKRMAFSLEMSDSKLMVLLKRIGSEFHSCLGSFPSLRHQFSLSLFPSVFRIQQQYSILSSTSAWIIRSDV